MLAYAFQVLNENGYKDIATEQFDNVGELCAAILTKGVALQLKRGLGREYSSKTEPLSSLRGKIDIAESIKTQAMQRKQLVCSYDDFTVNSYMNQILKSTMELLARSDISKARKKELRKLLIFFNDVDTLNVHDINWRLQYNRNNQSYQMLVSICYLVVNGLLQSNTTGSMKLMEYLDEQRMCRLYEKFILEYYRKEHPEIKASASRIPWQLDDDFDAMLPVMQTDIMLSKGNTVLIIDAKYYAHTTQSQHGVNTQHSGNMYQIFTYVKNKTAQFGNQKHIVSGMLLYAQTDDSLQPNHVYHMNGNQITVRTLNLNLPFTKIAAQLDEIVKAHFAEN